MRAAACTSELVSMEHGPILLSFYCIDLDCFKKEHQVDRRGRTRNP
ncbi:hypothetical protein L810_2578 [Burkholderia sp. AU4i]|nr:hypothetical protein L810_2578 [Burkholderia sp. AU4i]